MVQRHLVTKMFVEIKTHFQHNYHNHDYHNVCSRGLIFRNCTIMFSLLIFIASVICSLLTYFRCRCKLSQMTTVKVSQQWRSCILWKGFEQVCFEDYSVISTIEAGNSQQSFEQVTGHKEFIVSFIIVLKSGSIQPIKETVNNYNSMLKRNQTFSKEIPDVSNVT